jgi:hypothetical protein
VRTLSTAVRHLVVPARFNGPPDSGNGGYVAGRLAVLLPSARAVQVTLRQPPPLEVPLEVRAAGGGLEAVRDGGVVAAAEPADLTTDPLPPVPFESAVAAQERYAGLTAHPFPTCFVCGTERVGGDGMHLRPGRVDAADGPVATTWVPDASLVDESGAIPAAMVWAAMDCPGGWASDIEARPMVLGRVTAAVHAVPQVGERCVVVGQVRGGEGRKTFTASTAYDEDGRVLGHAESVWIEVRRDTAG